MTEEDRKARKRAYNAAHYARTREERAEYREARGGEQRRQYDADRYVARRAQMLEQKAEYYKKNQLRLAEYRKANRQQQSEYKRRWRKDNSDKINAGTARRRHRLAKIDPTGIEAAFASGMSRRSCALCGAPGPSSIDHIVPLSWVDTLPEVAAILAQPWAYQPLCASCNCSKHARGVWCFVPTGDIG